MVHRKLLEQAVSMETRKGSTIVILHFITYLNPSEMVTPEKKEKRKKQKKGSVVSPLKSEEHSLYFKW